MLYTEKPSVFRSAFEVVSCVYIVWGKILLLHRQWDKPQGGTWGLPAGKLHAGESLVNALSREVHEEIGVEIDVLHFAFHAKTYVVYPEYDFMYYIYSYSSDSRPEITLNKTEHSEYVWVTPQEALGMYLIQDEDTALKIVFPNMR